MQVVKQVVGELVPCHLDNNSLKLLWLNESIAVLVKEAEGLADALALQSAKHLRELMVCQLVPPLLTPRV